MISLMAFEIDENLSEQRIRKIKNFKKELPGGLKREVINFKKEENLLSGNYRFQTHLSININGEDKRIIETKNQKFFIFNYRGKKRLVTEPGPFAEDLMTDIINEIGSVKNKIIPQGVMKNKFTNNIDRIKKWKIINISLPGVTSISEKWGGPEDTAEFEKYIDYGDLSEIAYLTENEGYYVRIDHERKILIWKGLGDGAFLDLVKSEIL